MEGAGYEKTDIRKSLFRRKGYGEKKSTRSDIRKFLYMGLALRKNHTTNNISRTKNDRNRAFLLKSTRIIWKLLQHHRESQRNNIRKH